jgi:ubiquitin-protein ligase
MIKKINVRFFSYCITDFDDVYICEVSESQFLELQGVITYARHSVFDNGVNQVCLTIEPTDYPMQCDIELKEAA